MLQPRIGGRSAALSAATIQSLPRRAFDIGNVDVSEGRCSVVSFTSLALSSAAFASRSVVVRQPIWSIAWPSLGVARISQREPIPHAPGIHRQFPTPVTFWVGYTHRASIGKLKPMN